MNRVYRILLLTVLLCSLVVPAFATEDNGNVFIGSPDDFVQSEIFQKQDAVTAAQLSDIPTDNAVNDKAILVSPAKYSKNWLAGEPGSWLEVKVVWKTFNGVDHYHFKVIYDGQYKLAKSNLKSDL